MTQLPKISNAKSRFLLTNKMIDSCEMWSPYDIGSFNKDVYNKSKNIRSQQFRPPSTRKSSCASLFDEDLIDMRIDKMKQKEKERFQKIFF